MPRTLRETLIRRGLSMVEAIIAMTITTVAGAALLVSLGGAVMSSTAALETTVAEGLALQLMNEIASQPYSPPVAPAAPPSGPATYYHPDRGSVSISRHRRNFRSIRDYANWSSTPPITREGVPVGLDGQVLINQSFRMPQLQADLHYLENITRSVQVEQVQPASQGGWSVSASESGYLRVTVRISFTDGAGVVRPLSESRRIFRNVPTAP